MIKSLFISPLRLSIASGIVFTTVATSTVRAEFTRELERSASASQLQAIVLEVVGADIELVGTTTERVDLRARFTADTDRSDEAEELFENLDFTMNPRGERLHVILKPKTEPRFWGLFGSRSLEAADARLQVSIPQQFQVVVESVSGSVSIGGVSGDHRVDTVSGEISVSRSHGNHVLDTVSGDVSVMDSAGNHRLDSVSGDLLVRSGAGDITADTVSGDVRIEDFPGAHRADTVSGDISASLIAAPARACRFDTVSGNVRITVPGDFSAHVVADTVNGSIDFGLEPGSIQKREDDHLEAIFGTGGDQVSFDTVSGDIRIESLQASR